MLPLLEARLGTLVWRCKCAPGYLRGRSDGDEKQCAEREPAALAEEIERLQDLTRPQLQESLTRVFGDDPPDAPRALLARPRARARGRGASADTELVGHWVDGKFHQEPEC